MRQSSTIRYNAVTSGLAHAQERGATAVVQVDGDGQHDADCIPELLAPLEAGADLVVGKVCDDGGSCPNSAVIAGMEWAAPLADVINLSLGGQDFPGVDPLEEAVNRLTAQTGALFVIAAGRRFYILVGH